MAPSWGVAARASFLRERIVPLRELRSRLTDRAGVVAGDCDWLAVRGRGQRGGRGQRPPACHRAGQMQWGGGWLGLQRAGTVLARCGWQGFLPGKGRRRGRRRGWRLLSGDCRGGSSAGRSGEVWEGGPLARRKIWGHSPQAAAVTLTRRARRPSKQHGPAR